jgi:hypothetical protein
MAISVILVIFTLPTCQLIKSSRLCFCCSNPLSPLGRGLG